MCSKKLIPNKNNRKFLLYFIKLYLSKRCKKYSRLIINFYHFLTLKKISHKSPKPIILIHPGILFTDSLNIQFPVSIIGAFQNKTNLVEIQSSNETIITFNFSSSSSYLGYLTLKLQSAQDDDQNDTSKYSKISFVLKLYKIAFRNFSKNFGDFSDMI